MHIGRWISAGAQLWILASCGDCGRVKVLCAPCGVAFTGRRRADAGACSRGVSWVGLDRILQCVS